MLKRITNKDNLDKKKLNPELLKPLPSSNKVYVSSNRFKDVKVGMHSDFDVFESIT